jgi:hypothetical protein
MTEDLFHSNLYTVEKFAPFSYKILHVAKKNIYAKYIFKNVLTKKGVENL